MPSEPPRVESFVLRFVSEDPLDHPSLAEVRVLPTPGSSLRWRGTVVHVQTNQEKAFTRIADAIAFISRYVPVGDSAPDDARPGSELPPGKQHDGASE